ncbi:long-chain fatty acid--CoA ligase [Rhodococcus zopfii]|uniref:Long-chain fatty acid--CoA ligase n=1 Tax=Rhodococcus zopfii TaxID=43772 RepID=A0ABU3WSV5_9NOCA|nr:long-chain fatty acid--CoA ligase [Rhodococcus zopfii]
MNSIGLATWLRRRAERDGDRSAVTFAGETLSFSALQRDVEAFADVLAACGIQPGERVAYVGFNHSRFLVALFATARVGAIFVPLNFRFTGTELAHNIEDSGAALLIADDAHTAPVDEVRDGLGVQRFLRLGGGADGWDGVDDLLAGTHPHIDEAVVDVDSPALILYTSGTTGRPKGAILTHRNLWTSNVNWMLAVNYNAEHVALTCAPLFHSGGMCVMTLPVLMAGGHVIVHEHFDAALFHDDIEKYRVTSLFMVPAMMLFASRHERFAAADLSSVRIIVAGAAPVPEPMLRLYGARGIPVSQCWGLTETATGATFLGTDRALDKLGSCGTAGMLNEVRLIDFDGDLLTTPGVHGELCVRGDTVTPGYWNMPEATAAALGADGWLRTGDVAYQDEDGYFYIADRLKDMIISGGENVYPAEVESVLYGHPSITEVAVIGAPDERWGERVVAVAVLAEGADLELEELREFAGAELARYKLPLELRIVDVLPRNTTGKVLKHELRARATTEV